MINTKWFFFRFNGPVYWVQIEFGTLLGIWIGEK